MLWDVKFLVNRKEGVSLHLLGSLVITVHQSSIAPDGSAAQNLTEFPGLLKTISRSSGQLPEILWNI